MKVGVFSGTFDPVHSGHIDFAKQAAQEAGLDKVYMLVERKPWRKTEYQNHEHRLAMLKLATKDEPKLSAEFQLKHETHNFEEAAKEFESEFGKKVDIYLLMGGDVFENIERWDDFKDIVKEFSFIAALRTEDDGEIIIDIKSRIKDIDLVMVPSPAATVSSSRIRNSFKTGQNPEGLDQKVYDYIKEHSLYGYEDRKGQA